MASILSVFRKVEVFLLLEDVLLAHWVQTFGTLSVPGA